MARAARPGALVGGLILIGPLLAHAIPPPRLSPAHVREQDGPTLGALELERTHGGGYRHYDRSNGFEATIHPDGRVTFRDIARFKATSTYEPAPDDGSAWSFLRGPYAPKQNVIEETGNPRILYGPYGPPPILIGIGGTMGGLSDIKNAANTGRKAAKREFLARTEDMRLRMASSAERRRAAQALATLRLELMLVWTDERRTYAQRRATLFQRWDESLEATAQPRATAVSLGAAGTTLGETGRVPVTVDAGAEARRRIERFIRHVAPQGSAHAFPRRELQRFNAQRRSQRRFDPYRDADPGRTAGP